MNFSALVQTIQQTHDALQRQAVNAVNRSLTIRNWLIGFYIVEFEQKGEDKATYGEKLLLHLADELQKKKVSNSNERELRRYRRFYIVYPQLSKMIRDYFTDNFRVTLLPESADSIRGAVSPESVLIEQTPSAQSEVGVLPDKIISHLSFSHNAELLPIDDPFKRTFYEIECIKGTWSIRELRRQIKTLYYERSGLSKHPEKLSAIVKAKAEMPQPLDVIKSVYTFEFLGLRPNDVVEESDLETALLNHLQEFLLELGHGFCFEARQKKLLIGDKYYFIDLVFYHRVLKCHVLLDLKVDEFDHVDAGQINTYLNYYKKEVLLPGDNPPVGILLVTDKSEALVEYATAGMDNQLFVSKYLVQLPSKEQLLQFVKEQLSQF